VHKQELVPREHPCTNKAAEKHIQWATEVLVGVVVIILARRSMKSTPYVSRGDRNIIAADIRVKRLMNNIHTVASDPDVCIYGKGNSIKDRVTKHSSCEMSLTVLEHR
jgi:hypothetical protein